MGHTLEYPKEVMKRLSIRFEVNEITDPGKIELWLHPDQADMGIMRARAVFEGLKQNNLRERCLSYGHLRWLEDNPEQIPAHFFGKQIFAWGSIVETASGQSIPYLECSDNHGSPYVHWESICWTLWLETMPAALTMQ